MNLTKTLAWYGKSRGILDTGLWKMTKQRSAGVGHRFGAIPSQYWE